MDGLVLARAKQIDAQSPVHPHGELVAFVEEVNAGDECIGGGVAVTVGWRGEIQEHHVGASVAGLGGNPGLAWFGGTVRNASREHARGSEQKQPERDRVSFHGRS